MNVLSLFDGMSCGMIALDRLGIKVDNYYASEIDKYAIQVSQANYPEIIQVGDITKLDLSTLPQIDLVMGGSPCQGFSFAGKQLAFDDPRSALFFEFVKCVEELNPKYFLLENVKMKKEYLDIISEYMGVEPIFINSSLVSAQSRQRYYWTNIPNVEQPEERGIVLRDILETNTSNKYLAGENLQKNYKGGNQLNPNYKSQANTIHDVDGKSGTICAGTHGYANGYVGGVDPKYHLSDKAIAYMNRGSEKYTGKKTRAEHYIKHECEKSKTLTANMHKGVPYGVIAIDKPQKLVDDTNDLPEKSQTIKSQYYKSSKANFERSGTFHATGIPQKLVSDKPQHIGTAVDVRAAAYRGRYNEDGSTSQKLELRKDEKTNTITTVQKDNVLTKDEVYWRKLTPLECERLQTVPDNYTNHVSNTQRYKMLGNGWTIEVIAHILKNMEV